MRIQALIPQVFLRDQLPGLVLATHFVAATAMSRCRKKAEERLDGLQEPLLPKDGAAEAPDADAKPPAHRQARRLLRDLRRCSRPLGAQRRCNAALTAAVPFLTRHAHPCNTCTTWHHAAASSQPSLQMGRRWYLGSLHSCCRQRKAS